MRSLLQYRATAVAGIATQLVFGLIMVMIYEAFYRSTTTPMPMSLRETVAYVWLGQAMLGMFPWNVDPELRQQIRTGGVAYELLRPVDLYGLWYARAMARRSAPTLLRAVPMFIVAGLFLGLQPPPTWQCAATWAAATGGALLLSCAITTLLAITLMWTISGEGISLLVISIVSFMSGLYVPLPFFPDWLADLADVLPFRGLADIPFRLYLGHIPPSDSLPLLAHQLGWVGALILLGRLLLARGRRRLVVQGG